MMLANSDVVENEHWMRLAELGELLWKHLRNPSLERGGAFSKEKRFLELPPLREAKLCLDFIENRRALGAGFRSADAISGSLVISSDSVSANNLLGSIVFVVGAENAKVQAASTMMGCLIYCDGDVSADDSLYSIVIATGRIVPTRHTHSTHIEQARKSGQISLFTPEFVGLNLGQDKPIVVSVTKNSPAAKCGLQAGDVIVSESDRQRLTRSLRRSYATLTDHTLQIRRDGRVMSVSMSFLE
jgi:hypothetical protein